ncbi:major facilitator superfamily domain-containing protein [Microdochium bolleyi]|uniref:Major facilitator superfamily domain-containing protein n=1 Tax=Microdochium bolleyi TaxID=196109 RepID=A0A136IRX1_9PEZI|nr:major facilitator superfamily domain-containing protein [Microdochium bolleyi]
MVLPQTSSSQDGFGVPSHQTPLLQQAWAPNYDTASSPSLSSRPISSSSASSESSDSATPGLDTGSPRLLGHQQGLTVPLSLLSSQSSWSALPHKAQLAVIVLARLAEPLSERAFTSYLFHQLTFLNPRGTPAADIVLQAGYLTATFAAAQCLTAMLWGRAADSESWGRKKVLVVGLVGSAAAALGMGFARTFWEAVCWRALAGGVNGNVGVLRTMVSEVVGERRHQPRAFLLLPMCYNVGVIIGPLLAGFLADPVRALPSVFGPGGILGGERDGDGNRWLLAFPYVLPNLLFASVLGTAALAVVLGLDETHPRLQGRPDRGRRLGKAIMWRYTGSRKKRSLHSTIGDAGVAQGGGSASPEEASLLADCDGEVSPQHEQQKRASPGPRLRQLLTPNILLTMLQRFLHALHMSAFYAIFSTLLPTPRSHTSPSSPSHRPFFFFAGGLGLSSQQMGLASTTLGALGLPLQILLYPRLVATVGVRSSYRAFLPLSIAAYVLLPLVILVPEDQPGFMWACLVGVLALQVVSRTFVNPATIMLVNDCATGGGVGVEDAASMLGTIHGLAMTISSAARIVGPTAGGWLLGWGLRHDLVALPLWILAGVAGVNWAVLWWIRDVDME